MPEPARLELRIRWRDLDGFNHVNNAVYFTYLEEARDAFVLGLVGPVELDRFVVRRVEIDYLGQLVKADVAVVAEVGLEGLGTTSVRTTETIHARSDGRLVARARGVLVYCDAERQRAEPLPDSLRAAIAGV